MNIDAFSLLLGIGLGVFAVVCVRLVDSIMAMFRKGKNA